VARWRRLRGRVVGASLRQDRRNVGEGFAVLLQPRIHLFLSGRLLTVGRTPEGQHEQFREPLRWCFFLCHF
jgi:hypothetical protein